MVQFPESLAITTSLNHQLHKHTNNFSSRPMNFIYTGFQTCTLFRCLAEVFIDACGQCSAFNKINWDCRSNMYLFTCKIGNKTISRLVQHQYLFFLNVIKCSRYRNLCKVSKVEILRKWWKRYFSRFNCHFWKIIENLKFLILRSRALTTINFSYLMSVTRKALPLKTTATILVVSKSWTCKSTFYLYTFR